MRVIVLVVAATLATGCDRPRDPLARCHALTGRRVVTEPERVIAVCGAAHAETGDVDALAEVAKAHLRQGDREAVRAIARSLPDDPRFARIWHLMGDAEQQTGDRASARHWFAKSLAVQRDVDPFRAFNTALGLAELAVLDDDLEAALDFAYQAVGQSERSRDRGARLLATVALADLLLTVGDRRTAGAVLTASGDDTGDRSTGGRDHLRALGAAEELAGHPATASSFYQRCVDDFGVQADPLVAVRCHLGLARLALARGPGAAEAAEPHLRAAAELEPRVLEHHGPDADRDGERALLAAELEVAHGRADAAITALAQLERRRIGTSLRARVATRLGELLADAGHADRAEVALQEAADAVEQLRDGAHYRETRVAYGNQLREPYEALFALRAERGNLPGALAALDRALTRDFIDRLAAEGSSSAGRALATDQAVADAIARTALRRRLDIEAAASPGALALADEPATTIVAFFSARGRLWRATLRPRVPPALAAVGSLDELAAAIDGARGEPGGTEAAALAARLLPAEALPRGSAPLVIVPDRTLDGVRFAALPVRGRHLVELHPITIAPTLRIAAGHLDAASPPTTPVVLGDPTGDLPGALDEARAVAAQLGVTPQLGSAAGRGALAAARRASVLHIASHGDRTGGRSVLRLHDGELAVGDLLALGLAPDLAVVASCVSAAQDADEMWTSIAAGLLASGARGVLGVQGRLPDDAGRTMLAAFYRHGGPRAPARALAAVQREAIAAGVPVEVWSMLVYLGSADADTVERSGNVAGGPP